MAYFGFNEVPSLLVTDQISRDLLWKYTKEDVLCNWKLQFTLMTDTKSSGPGALGKEQKA